MAATGAGLGCPLGEELGEAEEEEEEDPAGFTCLPPWIVGVNDDDEEDDEEEDDEAFKGFLVSICACVCIFWLRDNSSPFRLR